MTAPPGPWVPSAGATPLETAATRYSLSGLTNGTTYDFAVGRVVNGFVGQWSSIPSATPLGGGVYDSIGTFTVESTSLIDTITRAAGSTTLKLSANWQYVVIDYVQGGAAKKHGVTKTNGFSLPTGYTTNAVISSPNNDNTRVNISLLSTQEFTLRVQGNGGSTFTMTLLAVTG
jgi:hypothetical protein